MRALLTACCYYQLLRGDYGGLPNATERAEQILSRAPRPARESSAIIKGARACQHGQSAVWAVPQLGSCSSSGHSWRLWAARYSQEEVGPLGAQPLPRVLELAASQAAYFTAFDHSARLCSALARLLRLLRAHLAALGGSRHPRRRAGRQGAPLKSLSDHSGVLRLREAGADRAHAGQVCGGTLWGRGRGDGACGGGRLRHLRSIESVHTCR